MLEIIILVILCQRMGQIVRARGGKAINYQLMLIGMWFGGELLGGLVGGFLAAALGSYSGGFPLEAYVCALVGAIVGSVVAFRIGKSAGARREPSGFPVIQYPPPVPEAHPQDPPGGAQ